MGLYSEQKSKIQGNLLLVEMRAPRGMDLLLITITQWTFAASNGARNSTKHYGNTPKP